jgi:hypothetical protein
MELLVPSAKTAITAQEARNGWQSFQRKETHRRMILLPGIRAKCLIAKDEVPLSGL